MRAARHSSTRPGVVVTKVVYFGVNSSNVLREQMGTKPAKVGHLAATLLKYVGSGLRNEDLPLPPRPPRSSRSVWADQSC